MLIATGQSLWLGVLYGTLAAISFSLWGIYLQRGLAAGATARDSIVVLAMCLTGSFLPTVLASGWMGTLPPLNWTALAMFVLAGLMTAGIGPITAAHATNYIGAANVITVRLLDPFFALVMAWLFLGDRISLGATLGIVLIAVALPLLQLDRGRGPAPQGQAGRGRGLALAVATSFFLTVGSVARKAGLLAMPSVWVAGEMEGLTGAVVVAATLTVNGAWGTVKEMFDRRRLDLWWSGMGVAFGTLFLNLSLLMLPVPIAVALRNSSPWFTLLFVPILIRRQNRPGPWVWISTGLLTIGMLLIVLR